MDLIYHSMAVRSKKKNMCRLNDRGRFRPPGGKFPRTRQGWKKNPINYYNLRTNNNTLEGREPREKRKTEKPKFAGLFTYSLSTGEKDT